MYLARILATVYVVLLLLATESTARRDAGNPGDKNRVAVVESSEELHEALQEEPALSFSSSHSAPVTINVDDSVRYQQIDGFGASLTDSSAWLLAHKLNDAQRKSVMEMLFSPSKGIGLSILRQPMGSSDFAAVEDYSYDDMPAGQSDPKLAKFSIDRDRAYILPQLREALALNPKLKIISSPWSPPGWMKTSGSMIKGTLLPSAYGALAQYFVKYVQAYEAAGVPIYGVTPENEPLNIPSDYPGMGMSAEEQTTFVRDYLGPAFREAKLKTKIMVFDHNWDLIDFPIRVLSDPAASKFAAGIAIHCYGGDVSAQSELHRRFPDKDIWLTECSGGEWQKGKLFPQQVGLVIGATRNWARSVVLWNLALNQDHRPFLGGCTTCRGVITVNDSATPAVVTPTVDFTALAHASKFVKPGAYRIDSNASGPGSLENVAFANPDGSIVVIVLNSSDAAASFDIGWKGKYVSYKLEGAAAATFRWSASAGSH